MSTFDSANLSDNELEALLSLVGHSSDSEQRAESDGPNSPKPLNPSDFLSHPNATVRVRALGASARTHALTTDALIEAFSDDDERPALRALSLAASYRPHGEGERQILDALLATIETSDIRCEAALFALGERLESSNDVSQRNLGIVETIESIAASHSDSLCRESAVAALGTIGWERSKPVILAALGDKATVRRRAVIALAAFDGDEVEAALSAATGDRDWQVRDIATALAHPQE